VLFLIFFLIFIFFEKEIKIVTYQSDIELRDKDSVNESATCHYWM